MGTAASERGKWANAQSFSRHFAIYHFELCREKLLRVPTSTVKLSTPLRRLDYWQHQSSTMFDKSIASLMLGGARLPMQWSDLNAHEDISSSPMPLSSIASTYPPRT